MATVKTQGTGLYVVSGPTAALAATATAISGISASRSQIETTDLAETTAKTYVSGLAEPGQATFELQFDPSSTTHKELHTMYKNGTVSSWALGWSDGTAAPTVEDSEFVLPTTRTFLTFDAYLTDISFDFSVNAVVKASCSLQVSGFPNLVPKA